MFSWFSLVGLCLLTGFFFLSLIGLVGEPDTSDRTIIENPCESTDVIDVAVGRNEEIDAADVVSSEGLGKDKRISPSIDENDPSSWIAQENRIALADVEERRGRDRRCGWNADL